MVKCWRITLKLLSLLCFMGVKALIDEVNVFN